MREDRGARSEALGPGEQAHRHAAYPVSLSASGLWSKCLIHGSKFLEDLVLSEYSEACHLVVKDVGENSLMMQCPRWNQDCWEKYQQPQI